MKREGEQESYERTEKRMPNYLQRKLPIEIGVSAAVNISTVCYG